MAKKDTLFGKPRNQVIKHPGAFSEAARRAKMSTHQLQMQVLGHPENYGMPMIREATLSKSFETMRKMKKAKKKK